MYLAICNTDGPLQVLCMKQGTRSQYSGTIQRDGVGREVRGGSGWGGHMYTCGLFMLMYGNNQHIQFSSFAQSCPTLCDPMNCSMPGLPVHHQLPEFTQTHPAISSSVIPLSSCPQSLPVSGFFPMSHLFAWGGQTIGVSASALVLPMNTQDWSPLRWTGWSPCIPRDSQESSPTPQFKSINSSALSFLYSPTLYIHTWLLEKP